METESRFDRGQLRVALQRLTPRSRAVFAALCARRLAPAYARADGAASENASGAFAELHAQLWRGLAGDSLGASVLEEAIGRALALLPAEEGDEPLAEDAVAALVYAFRTAAGGEAQDAAWAAERVYNALDTFLQGWGYDPGALGGEEALRGHPLIQAELQRQAEDLTVLREMEGSSLAGGALEDLRGRTDAAQVFG